MQSSHCQSKSPSAWIWGCCCGGFSCWQGIFSHYWVFSLGLVRKECQSITRALHVKQSLHSLGSPELPMSKSVAKSGLPAVPAQAQWVLSAAAVLTALSPGAEPMVWASWLAVLVRARLAHPAAVWAVLVSFCPHCNTRVLLPRLSRCLHSLLHPPGSLNRSLRSFLSFKSSQDRISLGHLGEVNRLAMRRRRVCGAAFSCCQLRAGLWLVPLHSGGPGLLSKGELGAPKQ